MATTEEKVANLELEMQKARGELLGIIGELKEQQRQKSLTDQILNELQKELGKMETIAEKVKQLEMKAESGSKDGRKGYLHVKNLTPN